MNADLKLREKIKKAIKKLEEKNQSHNHEISVAYLKRKEVNKRDKGRNGQFG